MPAGAIKIVTRKSPLALWQAEHVRSRLQQTYPGLVVELLGVQTTGDRIQDAPLAKIGGKGLFVKELEQQLLSGSADLAVHSMKDVPVQLPDGLHIAAVLEREDPRDAFLSTQYPTLEALPPKALVGTSSLRRQCQLLALRPQLRLGELRGNVDTRLRKLAAGDYHAIILAAAGVKRLRLEEHIQQIIEPEIMLPAIGQGAIGIECRQGDRNTEDLITALNHPDTWDSICAERALNTGLNGGCQVPIAGFTRWLADGQLELQGLVANLEGTRVVRGTIRGPRAEAERMGFQLANDLLERGAAEILKTVMTNHVD